jgi:hypothetical protein
MKNIKKLILLIFFFAVIFTTAGYTQCSICTKTASQLGEKQGKGLNSGIIYLMLMPLTIGSYIGFRWWRHEKALKESPES